VVPNPDVKRSVVRVPANCNRALSVETCVNGIAHEIDECLFDLVTIALEDDLSAWNHTYGTAGFQGNDTAHQRRNLEASKHRFGHLGKGRVGSHKPVQGLGSGPYDLEPTVEVLAPIFREGIPGEKGLEA
jgi:hypothetical protein